MNRFFSCFFQFSLQRMLSQSLLLGALATTGLLTNALSESSKVSAQTPPPVNTNEVTNYARVLLEMEPERQQAFNKIKEIVGDGEVPKIVCNDPSTLGKLPPEARGVAVNYCNRSRQIAEARGLSSDRFNEITLELQTNENLKRQVYNTLIRLQKKP